jgi:PEP-CTERM motif
MNAKQKKLLTVVASAVLFVLLPSIVRADDVQLTLSNVTSAAGTTVTVDGTITNDGSSTVDLNGESFSFGSSVLSGGNTIDFFIFAPFFLSGGESTGPIALFSFNINLGTPAGSYAGNTITIVGGPDSSSQDALASAEFSATVPGSKPVPEPASLALLGIGVTLLWMLQCRVRRAL